MSQRITDRELLETLDVVEEVGLYDAAQLLDRSVRTIQDRCKRARALRAAQGASPGFALPPTPQDTEEPLEELLDRRVKVYERKARATRIEHAIRVNVSGPFGLLIFGDPHLDDDGTDLALIRRHLELVKDTPGLFACTLGDLHNNWPGRLARLYAEQGTSAQEAWRLVEWFLGAVPWLFVIRGNHDEFSGPGDPLSYIVRGSTVGVDQAHGARIRLDLPEGDPVRIWARHTFPGHSQWNKAHGPVKAAKMGGYRADVFVAGHKHTWAQHTEEGTDGQTWTALQVGAYKRIDDYADKLGYAREQHGAAVLLVVRPKIVGPGRITPFWDVESGRDYLTWLRQ